MFSALIIDADPEAARDIELVLRNYNFNANTCYEASDAMNLARTTAPDIIFLRVELPATSGFSFCNKLRRNEDTKAIPLVMYASDVSEEVFNQHRSLKTHADDYLKLPIQTETLMRAVRRLLPTVPESPAPPTRAHIEVELEDANHGKEDSDLADATDAAFDALVDLGPAEAPAATANVEPTPVESTPAHLPASEPDTPTMNSSTPVSETNGNGDGGADFRAQRDVIQLKSQLNAKNRELLSVREELEEQQRAVLDAKHRNRELLSQIGDLEEKLLNAEETVINARERAQVSTQSAIRERDELKTKIETLTQELAATDASASERADTLARENLELSSTLEQTKAELDWVRKQAEELTQARDEMQTEVRSLRDQLDATRDELKRTKEDRHAAQEALETSRMNESDVEEATKRITELEAELSQLRDELNLAQRDREAASGEIVGLMDERDRLKQEVEQTRADWQTLQSSLQQDVARMTDELGEARQQLETRREIEQRAQRALAVALHVLDGQPTT